MRFQLNKFLLTYFRLLDVLPSAVTGIVKTHTYYTINKNNIKRMLKAGGTPAENEIHNLFKTVEKNYMYDFFFTASPKNNSI